MNELKIPLLSEDNLIEKNVGFNASLKKFYLSEHSNLILDKSGVKSTQNQELNKGKINTILASHLNG